VAKGGARSYDTAMAGKIRAVVLVLVVFALGGCGPDESGTTRPTLTFDATSVPGCPSGSTPVDLEFPPPAEVGVAVRNASGVNGRGLEVFVELGNRRFQVLSVTETEVGDYPEAVVIRFGPDTVGDAWLLASYFMGDVRQEFDAGRSSTTVDVILGRGFQGLHTPTEVNQAIAAAGRPTAPPGTCGIS